MRSDQPSPTGRGRPAPSAADDLTARARIRDAAISRFARDGFGAPLRTIAADAGVSAALVVHHFGSKDGLRAACDEHVLEIVRTSKREVMTDVAGATPMSAWFARVDDYAPTIGYALRSLQAGGELARAFVDHLTADTAEYIRESVALGTARPSRDEEARARYLVLSSMGTLLLWLTLDSPEEPGDLSTSTRNYLDDIALPALELFTEGFLTDRRMLDEYLLYVGDPPRGPAAPAHADDAAPRDEQPPTEEQT
ncbi:TetR/AcrR family transcriptional regulator [Cellulosimicrobium protaetiae]|uniref:TetR family transcriptional regulator n=1 Tax=Cellulosimicrobium protaetiae TaxID=2587808 RepID=A0A6M5UB09_9MICO|nr:TetR family transcriptional regulator [Cellulosimicrobium protaetiae]QJW35687.1 TetR family transcriptional regulator [Cellulosimicrobium protaetiae]